VGTTNVLVYQGYIMFNLLIIDGYGK
jgi:hypothetical protein